MAGGINFRLIMSPLSAAGVRRCTSASAGNIGGYICRRHYGSFIKDDAENGGNSLRSFPKVQLHIHLDGAVRHNTLWKAARKKGLSCPPETYPEFVNSVKCSSEGDLPSFLASFDRILPIIAGDRELISQIAYELCEDQVKEGVVYFEARYSPHLLASASANQSTSSTGSQGDVMTPRDVVTAVNDGIKRGCDEFKVKGRTILFMMRTCPESSHEVVELSHEFQNDSVVGIDMAGDEDAHCTKQHIDAFKRAGDLGLHRTVHAGEVGPAENVRLAVEQLGADRIGHGYQICHDPNIYKMIRDRFIHLELCPTSSIHTGAWKGKLSDHCARRFAEDGFNIGLNTDDPTLLSNTMESEFHLARTYFDFTDSYMKSMTLNTARASFLPEEQKTELVDELQNKFESL